MNVCSAPARRIGWPAVVLLGLLTAFAAAAAERPPREYLDEETGATVTVVDQALTFAYARQDLAANAHDFLTLAAAAVNRSGRIDYVLIGYFWSTADTRARTDPPPSAEPLVLVADDRVIELRLRGESAHDAGIGVPVHAPPGGGTPNVYSVDLATVRFIGATRRLALRAEVAATTLTYELWSDQRGAIRAFVRHMNGED